MVYIVYVNNIYLDHCIIFIPSEDKIDYIYASLQEYYKIEDDEDLNRYNEIYLAWSLDGSIHISQPYISQSFINMLPGMDK